MYKIDDDGIHTSTNLVSHRNDEYDESGFNTLFNMQSKHFWYIGRHRFILEMVRKYVTISNFAAVDLGGGCGGWVEYLKKNLPNSLSKIALADSSRIALLNARKIMGIDV
jgi:hypothetical protein